MNPIYLFCDVDGVLIPFPGPGDSIPATHLVHWARFAGEPEPVRIWLNPEHGPQLMQLVSDAGLEPTWCSSWRTDAAPEIGRRLGLAHWPSVNLPTPPTDSSHQNGHLWKLNHVAAHAGDNPLAWIDDDFTPADHVWAVARNASGIPTLLIEPNPHAGLRPEHLRVINEWAALIRYPTRAESA
jgi:hypothetical protein